MSLPVLLNRHTRVMKAVIAADTGEYSVFDLSGEELEKAFAKSLAHADRA